MFSQFLAIISNSLTLLVTKDSSSSPQTLYSFKLRGVFASSYTHADVLDHLKVTGVYRNLPSDRWKRRHIQAKFITIQAGQYNFAAPEVPSQLQPKLQKFSFMLKFCFSKCPETPQFWYSWNIQLLNTMRCKNWDISTNSLWLGSTQ